MAEPTKPSLKELGDAAFRQAAAKAILQARQAGTTLIVWDEGRVRVVMPDEAQAMLGRSQDRQG